MKRGTVVLIALLAIPLILSSCSENEIPLVAEVGGKPITLTNIENIVRIQPDWSEEKVDTAKSFALNELIQSKLLAIEGERMGFRDDEDVNVGLDQVERRILVGHLYHKVVVGRAKVAEWEVKRLYHRMGEEAKTRHILLETKERADSVYAQLTEAGRSFDELAMLTVDQETKGKGGDLGWVRWGRKMPEEFLKAAFSLKTGETSKPVKTERGYHIIRVEDRRPVERKPYEEWRPRLKKWLQIPIVERLRGEYFESMKSRARIRVDAEVLQMLANKTPEQDPAMLAPPPLPEVTDEEMERTLANSLIGEWSVGRVLDEASKTRQRPDFRQPDQVKNYVEFLITYELLVDQAKRLHLERSPAVKMELAHELDMRVAGKVVRETYGKIQASEPELMECYRKNIGYFTQPEKVHANIIVVDTEERARDILKELRKGAVFARLAKGWSTHPSKENGGDLGLIPRGRFPDIDEVAFSLKPGQISGIIRTEQGYAIVKVIRKEPLRVETFNEARERAESILLTPRREDELRNLLSDLRAKTEIVIQDERLRLLTEAILEQKPAAGE